MNVTGAMAATQTVLPLLRDSRGSLLFTGGEFALQPSPAYTTLSVGRAALRAYVQALHADQYGSDVHVSASPLPAPSEARTRASLPTSWPRPTSPCTTQPKDQWQAELVYA